jgi:hypothetical protein
MDTTTEPRLDPRSRQLHPERIVIGGETFVRNDIQAKELGISERSVNRDDRLGAPWIFIGGVKYRPEKRYAAFIMSRIQVRQPPSKQSQRKGRKRTAGSRALGGPRP